jgi:hypothetical protein
MHDKPTLATTLNLNAKSIILLMMTYAMWHDNSAATWKAWLSTPAASRSASLAVNSSHQQAGGWLSLTWRPHQCRRDKFGLTL